MSQKSLFFALLTIFIASLALLIYVKLHVGPDFVKSL
jgi:hypothetical protein